MMNSKRPFDYDERVARFQAAVAQDSTNAAAYAALAQVHWEAEEWPHAIHNWRMAISASPNSALTQGWKSKLKRALEMHERAEQGLEGDGFADFKVCHHCHADIPVKARKCPRCEKAVEMTFFEWIRQEENWRAVVRTAAPLVLVIAIVVMVVARLPFEVKACVIMATVAVCVWRILGAIGRTSVG